MGVKKKFSLGRLGLFVVLMMLTINIAFRMDVSAAVLTEQSLQGVSISEQSENFLGQNEMKSVAGSNEEEKLEAELAKAQNDLHLPNRHDVFRLGNAILATLHDNAFAIHLGFWRRFCYSPCGGNFAFCRACGAWRQTYG